MFDVTPIQKVNTLPLYALLLKFQKPNLWRVHFEVKGRGDFCPKCAFSKASKFRLLAPGLHIWTKRSRSNGLAWIQYLYSGRQTFRPHGPVNS
ncbi:hypothetical protein TNCV_1355711 [Trichonephila clavipes]|uniref:Uncharacterized protein n=1 Tax=Trichonephila clavipes TaxID=2585209 RepID=A0A8X6SB49_TRICX|nr:hypothetical protein TNCV_1355711 [Trichonephila clavipes]